MILGASFRSLFAFGSQSADSEEGRAFLQARVALFARLMLGVMGVLLCFTFVFATSLRWFYPNLLNGETALPPWAILHGIQAAIVLKLTFLWRYCRTGVRPLWFLRASECFGTITLCWSYTAILFFVESRARPELMLVLAITHTLVARAAVIPSAGGRTLFVGVVSLVPLIIGAFLRHLSGNDPTWLGPPILAAVQISLWSVIAAVVTVVISNVIYGLQKRVEEVLRLGQYTLEEKIGEGGMGEVYRASHAMLRRPTAIKLLPPERAGAHNLARFEREVQLTSKLTHPNTVAIYDFGRTPAGLFYYAMEYLEGITLEQLVKHGGPQPAGRVVHLLSQMTGALAEAHAAGLIHRDIKPANVILCERGGAADVVKVVDFGLVKDLGNTKNEIAVSNVNVLTGTPLYLSPEAITSPESLDGRADLYAVGAVGYFLLTGRTVFEGKTVVEICGHHLHSVPVAPSTRLGKSIEPRLEAAILACLAKAPAQRPASARVLHDTLETIAATEPWTPSMARDAWATHAALGLRSGERSGMHGMVGVSRAGPTLAIDLRDRELG